MKHIVVARNNNKYMGAYLDAPITDKNPVHGQNSMVAWGACGMQGWRCGMEDSHICEEI